MDNVINDKYQIQLEILTPLSIGAGSETEWAKGVDFVISQNKLYHLDLRKMKEDGIDINKLAAFWAERNQDAVIKVLFIDFLGLNDGSEIHLLVPFL